MRDHKKMEPIMLAGSSEFEDYLQQKFTASGCHLANAANRASRRLEVSMDYND